MAGYEVKPIQAEDTEVILDLLRRTFFIDEPMSQAVGLCNDGTSTELEGFCRHYLSGDGWSFKAVDQEGNIVGVLVSGINSLKETSESVIGEDEAGYVPKEKNTEFFRTGKPEEGSDYLSLAQKCKNPKFEKMLYVLAKREEGAKLSEKFPDENEVLDIKIAATDPNWRKKGIMNALLSETENLAKKRCVRVLRMDTSSAYSAMSAEKLGFTCIYSAPYSEIKLDGRPLIVPEPPHVDDRVYTKVLFEKNR